MEFPRTAQRRGITPISQSSDFQLKRGTVKFTQPIISLFPPLVCILADRWVISYCNANSFGETLIETTMTIAREREKKKKEGPIHARCSPGWFSGASNPSCISLSELRGFHGRRATDRHTDRPQSTSGVLAGCDNRAKWCRNMNWRTCELSQPELL